MAISRGNFKIRVAIQIESSAENTTASRNTRTIVEFMHQQILRLTRSGHLVPIVMRSLLNQPIDEKMKKDATFLSIVT